MPKKAIYYCGVEGSASTTKIVIFDSTGKEDVRKNLHWTHADSTHFDLVACKAAATAIADAVKGLLIALCGKEQWWTGARIKSMCMTLPGVEKPEKVDEFLNTFRQAYVGTGINCVCEEFFFASQVDSVLRSMFKQGSVGVALHAGTDAFCGLIMKDKTIRYPMTSNNQIGAGGGAYWIARTGINMILEDRNVKDPETVNCFGKVHQRNYTDRIEELFVRQFRSEGLKMQTHMFSKARRIEMAKFAKTLADYGNGKWHEKAICELFEAAGKCLGKLVSDVVQELPETDKQVVRVVMFGEVFRSLEGLHNGLLDALTNSGIRKLELYTLREELATMAAFLAAQRHGVKMKLNEIELKEENCFARNP